MDFLRLLEGLRTPVLDRFFSVLTYCGDELFFMVVAIAVFWCVSKRDGYYILIVGFCGTIFNQAMKLLFRIPRPWVLDPEFTIVESARSAASGYSFPSGHTQNIVSTMTCLILTNKQKWLRILAAALMILVPFSRMYLGCHTPLDVITAFCMALALALLLYPVLQKTDTQSGLMNRLLYGMLALSLLYLFFVSFFPFPADTDAENLYSGTKNAYTLLGSLCGLIAARALDQKYINFDVKAVWWAQILKVLLGLLLLLGIKAGLKPILQSFLPVYAAYAVRYALIVLFAGAVWPLTFRFFGRLGHAK